ncbi:hypothetical protein [Streptosporangium longisporum]|uniref:Uncharacterized protein n=1 Tax=Streptosporangium longisporum TaxID=46187 RepID=A0ABP6KYK3_9ACTN
MTSPAHSTDDAPPQLTAEEWLTHLQRRFPTWRIWRSNGRGRPGAWYATRPGRTLDADRPQDLADKLDKEGQAQQGSAG